MNVTALLAAADERVTVSEDELVSSLAAALRSAAREVAGLREVAHIGFELDNHHAAAVCPYCTPDADERAAATFDFDDLLLEMGLEHLRLPDQTDPETS